MSKNVCMQEQHTYIGPSLILDLKMVFSLFSSFSMKPVKFSANSMFMSSGVVS